jgi:hypothetical protein
MKVHFMIGDVHVDRDVMRVGMAYAICQRLLYHAIDAGAMTFGEPVEVAGHLEIDLDLITGHEIADASIDMAISATRLPRPSAATSHVLRRMSSPPSQPMTFN